MISKLATRRGNERDLNGRAEAGVIFKSRAPLKPAGAARTVQAIVSACASLLICVATSPAATNAVAAGAARHLSPGAMVSSPDGKMLYIACETADCILAFDTGTEKPVARFPVKTVGHLAIAPDGQRLFATAGGADGVLHEITLPDGKILRTLPAGHTPESPLYSADGKTLYYCNRFSRDDQPNVHALDLASGKVTSSGKAQREPVAMLLSKDGATLWVANHLPLMPANSEHVYAVLNLFDSKNLAPRATLDLPPGSFAICGATLSADGRYYFVTHSIGRFTVPTTHLDRGWINTSAVSIFEVETRKYLNSVLLDDTVLGAANPWGVGISGDGTWLCVNISGTHELIAINTVEMMKRLAATPNPREVVNDLAFLYGAKIRVPLEGQGPRVLTICGDRVYSAMRFSDSLSMVELWDDGPGASIGLPLAAGLAEPDAARQGEMALHDATLCYQQWLSCASCHPAMRSDGTNWDLLNDGIGNPKQSRSLLYTHKTSPVMITGVRDAAEIAVSKGFSMIQFHELPEEKLEPVNDFLKSLEPVRSPYRNRDGTLSAAARRGKKIFEGRAGCVKCHTPPYHADKKKYILGLGSDDERDREFYTPILIEAWRNAPYMYDGRALTIQDVISSDNTNNRHGDTKGLKPREIEDLAEYVNSL